MTYTHISYQNGDEFLLDHNAQDNGQTCRGDIVAMKIDDQWSRADRLAFTRVLLQTGNDIDGEGVHTVEEVIGQSLDSLPDARVVPEFYGLTMLWDNSPKKRSSLEPAPGFDVYEVVENLSTSSIVLSDLDNLNEDNLQM